MNISYTQKKCRIHKVYHEKERKSIQFQTSQGMNGKKDKTREEKSHKLGSALNGTLAKRTKRNNLSKGSAAIKLGRKKEKEWDSVNGRW